MKNGKGQKQQLPKVITDVDRAKSNIAGKSNKEIKHAMYVHVHVCCADSESHFSSCKTRTPRPQFSREAFPCDGLQPDTGSFMKISRKVCGLQNLPSNSKM